MGAEGGVNWMRLRKGGVGYDRCRELLKPFWAIWGEGTGRTNEHRDWLEAHPEFSAPEYVVAYYGTDVRLDGMRTLHDILLNEDERENLDYTFEEVWLDLRTRPTWQAGEFDRTALEELLYQCFTWRTNEEVFEALGPLRTVTVRAWITEMDRIVIRNSYSSAETWT